jgi:hypothetical protein
MIAQIILTGLLTFVLLYAWMEYRRAPIIGLLFTLAAATALYFVWVPAHATRLAALVGIGRGADLMLYIWVVISLLVLLNLHLKLRVQLEQITILTRQLAIANARERQREGAAGTIPP